LNESYPSIHLGLWGPDKKGSAMSIPRIYLETTMFSFYYEERTGLRYLEHKVLVRRIFDLIKAGAYKPYTSPYTTREISMATCNELDFIISLNFTHIVRPWTIEKVRIVNMREKYHPIGIYKPSEVLEIYEDGTRIYE
jgi:hypothetical protein